MSLSIADAYATDEDTPLAVPAPGTLENDGDPDSSSLRAVAGTQPANGTAVVNGDGSFTYTPSPDFFGTNSFTDDACDDGTPTRRGKISISRIRQ